MMRGEQHLYSIFAKKPSVQAAIDAGMMFAGTPDQVYKQIETFYHRVGGFGHLLMMGQAGFLEHEETAKSIRTFGREVLPRLKEAFPDGAFCGTDKADAINSDSTQKRPLAG